MMMAAGIHHLVDRARGVETRAKVAQARSALNRIDGLLLRIELAGEQVAQHAHNTETHP